MPLAFSPCCPLPEVELLRRVHITPKEAAEKLRVFVEEEAKALASSELEPTRDAASAEAVSATTLTDILQRLENDWVSHTEESLLDCFIEVEAHTEVHLHPRFMGPRMKQGLRKAAGEILLKFQRNLRCIPLTLADLKPAGSRHGAIVGDSPYIHFLARFRAVGFMPMKGHWLLGRVAAAQPSSEAMNINVLKLINISVHHDSLPRELRYHQQNRVWMINDTQLSEKHTVLLRILKKDTEVSRQGEMGIQLTGVVETTGHIRAKKRSMPTAGASSPGPSVAGARVSTPGQADTPVSKRRREKEGQGKDAGDGTAHNGTAHNGNAEDAEESHKKKKKDKKRKDKDNGADEEV